MEAKHTPGPWVVIQSGFHGDLYLVCEDVPGRLKPVCASEHGHPLAEANARLIAAAPDQNAVGRELHRLSLVIESAVRAADPGHHADVLELIMANRDAQAKAEGKQ